MPACDALGFFGTRSELRDHRSSERVPWRTVISVELKTVVKDVLGEGMYKEVVTRGI